MLAKLEGEAIHTPGEMGMISMQVIRGPESTPPRWLAGKAK